MRRSAVRIGRRIATAARRRFAGAGGAMARGVALLPSDCAEGCGKKRDRSRAATTRAGIGCRLPGGLEEIKQAQTAPPKLPPGALVFADFSKGRSAAGASAGPGLPAAPAKPGFPSLRSDLAAAGALRFNLRDSIRTRIRRATAEPEFAGFHHRKEIRQRAGHGTRWRARTGGRRELPGRAAAVCAGASGI